MVELVKLKPYPGACWLFHTDTDASSNSSVHKERAEQTPHAVHNLEQYDQLPEGHEEDEGDHETKTKPEQKYKVDQSQQLDVDEKEAKALPSRHQQEDVPDRDKAKLGSEISRDAADPEDTETVETFFSTMSHRYENATLEGHIL